MVDDNRQLVRGTTTILILSALGAEPMHGYGLVRELEARCQGLLAFKEGTIYPLLYGLEDRGLIGAAWVEGASGRRQKVYSLTAAGETYLGGRLEGWQRLVKAMTLALAP